LSPAGRTWLVQTTGDLIIIVLTRAMF